VEAFYRRTGDDLTQNQTLTSSTGAGLSYQTEFSTWRQLFSRVFGWLLPDKNASDENTPQQKADPDPAPVTRNDNSESGSSESEEKTQNPND